MTQCVLETIANVPILFVQGKVKPMDSAFKLGKEKLINKTNVNDRIALLHAALYYVTSQVYLVNNVELSSLPDEIPRKTNIHLAENYDHKPQQPNKDKFFSTLKENGICQHYNNGFCHYTFAGRKCKYSHICNYCGEQQHGECECHNYKKDKKRIDAIVKY